MFGWFAGDRDDLCNLLGGEFSSTASAWQVAEDFLNGGPFLHAFDEGQTVKRFLPTFTPDADAVSFAVKFVGNLLIGESIECKQNDLGAMGESLGRSACLDLSLKNILLSFGDDNLGSHSRHGSSSDGVLIFHRIIWQKEPPDGTPIQPR